MSFFRTNVEEIIDNQAALPYLQMTLKIDMPEIETIPALGDIPTLQSTP